MTGCTARCCTTRSQRSAPVPPSSPEARTLRNTAGTRWRTWRGERSTEAVRHPRTSWRDCGSRCRNTRYGRTGPVDHQPVAARPASRWLRPNGFSSDVTLQDLRAGVSYRRRGPRGLLPSAAVDGRRTELGAVALDLRDADPGQRLRREGLQGPATVRDGEESSSASEAGCGESGETPSTGRRGAALQRRLAALRRAKEVIAILLAPTRHTTRGWIDAYRPGFDQHPRLRGYPADTSSVTRHAHGRRFLL